MSDQYLIEAGIDNYLLEDSSGVLLIDQRVEVKNNTIGLTGVNNKSWVKVIVNNIGLSDVTNTAKGFVKQVADIIGLTGVNNFVKSEFEYILEDGTGSYAKENSGIYLQDYPLKLASTTIGVTEASQRNLGFIKQIAEVIGLTDVENHVTGLVKVVTQVIVSVESAINRILTEVNFYGLEDGTGRYQPEDGVGGYLLDQLQLLKFAASTIGLTEASQKLLGPVKQVLDNVGIVENKIRAMVMFRNTPQDTVGVTELNNRVGIWIRVLNNTVGITEARNRLGGLIRNKTSTVGIAEVNNFVRGLLKNIADAVGITEVNNVVTGIVKEILETIGLVESSNRIRTVFISNDTGTFTVKDAGDFDNFIVMSSLSIDNFVVIDSYNLSNMSIRDDD